MTRSSRFTSSQALLICACLAIVLTTCVFSTPPAVAAPGDHATAQSAEPDRPEFFKKLKSARDDLQMNPGLRDKLQKWHNKPKPFWGAFIITTFLALVGAAFFPGQLIVSAQCCREQFWRSLGKAILVLITLALLFRLFVSMPVTLPLAIVIGGLIELGIVAGLCVSVFLVGEGILGKLKLSTSSWSENHPRQYSLLRVLVGSLILSLIVMLPGIGQLPSPGSRIVMLIAVLGFGGLLKTRFGTRPLDPAPQD